MYDFKIFGKMNLDLIFKEFDHLPLPGEEIYASCFQVQLGGGATVISVVLAGLGCRVKLGTFLGEDEDSNLCRRLLAQKNFSSYEVFQRPGSAPVEVTGVFSWNGDRSLLSYSGDACMRALEDEAVFAFLRDAKVAFAPAAHPAVTRRLHEAGVKLVYDSGWKADMTIDDMRDYLPCIDIYTPNAKEAKHLAQTESVEEAVRFLARHTPCPVVTLGEEGCAYWDGETVRYVPAEKGLSVMDTTGAGDNFLAGVIYGLSREEPLENCLKLGNICAGQSVLSVGGLGAIITKEGLCHAMWRRESEALI